MPGMRFAPESVVSLWVSDVGLPSGVTLQTSLSSQMSSSRYPGVALKYSPEEGLIIRIP